MFVFVFIKLGNLSREQSADELFETRLRNIERSQLEQRTLWQAVAVAEFHYHGLRLIHNPLTSPKAPSHLVNPSPVTQEAPLETASFWQELRPAWVACVSSMIGRLDRHLAPLRKKASGSGWSMILFPRQFPSGLSLHRTDRFVKLLGNDRRWLQ